MIDLQAQRPQTIEIVLGPATGALTIQVTNGTETASAGTIVLMDEALLEDFREETVPKDGSLEIKSLGPGQYRLYAFEEFDGGLWESKGLRGLLEAKSVVIDLRDGERKNISVSLISKGDLARVVANIAN